MSVVVVGTFSNSFGRQKTSEIQRDNSDALPEAVISLELSEHYQQRRPLDKRLQFAQIAVSKLAIGAN